MTYQPGVLLHKLVFKPLFILKVKQQIVWRRRQARGEGSSPCVLRQQEENCCPKMATRCLNHLPQRFSREATDLNVWQMAYFQKLPFTFLLLIVLSDIQAEGDCLSCSKHIITEVGKGIIIECKNNAPIEKMGMTFHSSSRNLSYSTDVLHEQNRKLTLGKVTLKIQDFMAFLIISQVKISHEGNYTLTYVTEDCMDELTIFLEVFAPYTSPQVIKRNDTLVCTASGGYPEEKLYWVSKAGTNLTHNSTSESVKNEDGPFSLSNTLQLDSALSETEYCCTFSSTKVPSRQPASTCMTPESETFMTIAEKTTLKTTFIVCPIILLFSILLVVVLYRRRKKGASSAKGTNFILQAYSSENEVFSAFFQLKEEFPL
ncbi:butyrophilin subfamily 1 member A1-like isoform 2-T2 [Liasis olivaceus]